MGISTLQENIMKIKFDRIQKDLETINSYNDTPGRGVTRFSFSENERKSREYLKGELAKLSIDTWTDNIGNLRARWNPGCSSRKSILLGSHIDTVRCGGQFDGLYGVVSALEVFRCFAENDVVPVYPLEFIVFVEEEGSNFGSTTTGSKALVGKLDLEDIKKLTDKDGTSYYEYLTNMGLVPEDIGNDIIGPDEIAHMLELHVEQSLLLESEKAQIGIVKNVAGMKAMKITITGDSNHAGSTLMNHRSDPVVAAGIAIQEIEKIAKESKYPSTVATVGCIEVIPNVSNVIAGEILFTVDVRDVRQDGIDRAVQKLEKLLNEVCNKRNLELKIDIIGKGPCVELSQSTVGMIEECAKKLGAKYRLMNSGAVHDCALLDGLTEISLIFVPSKGGKSHCPEEYTSLEELSLGSQLLLDTVVKLMGK